jgi:hypothetical protein
MSKELTVTITLENERIFDMLENNDIKPSQAKINKLIKFFLENDHDYYEQLSDALEEALEEIALEEWGE